MSWASAVCQGFPWSSFISSLSNFVISNNCFHFINLISQLIKLCTACNMKISAIGGMFTSVSGYGRRRNCNVYWSYWQCSLSLRVILWFQVLPLWRQTKRMPPSNNEYILFHFLSPGIATVITTGLILSKNFREKIPNLWFSTFFFPNILQSWGLEESV